MRVVQVSQRDFLDCKLAGSFMLDSLCEKKNKWSRLSGSMGFPYAHLMQIVLLHVHVIVGHGR